MGSLTEYPIPSAAEYDFTLNTWIYYFPNTKNPGHYTTDPRYFSNLTTSQIFTM